MSYSTNDDDLDNNDAGMDPSRKRYRTAGGEGVAPNNTFGADVGGQVFKVIYDGDNLLSSGVGTLPQISVGAHTCHAGDILFALENDDRCLEGAIPVRKAFNELLEKFSQLFPGNVFMQTLALNASVRPLGCVKETVVVSERDTTPSLNNMYLGERPVDTIGTAYVGQPMKAVPRAFGPTQASNVRGPTDSPQNVYSYYLAPVDVQDCGKAFAKAAAELIFNSETWISALAGFPGVAEPWVAAVYADDRHVKLGGIIMVERLLKKGVLSLTGFSTVANVDRDAGGNVVNPVELLENGNVPNSYDIAATIADLIGLTTPADSKAGTLDAAGEAKYKELAHEISSRIYYTTTYGRTNAAAEFGAERNGSSFTFAGRYQQQANNEVTDSRVGCIVQLQMVHTQNAVSGFRHAIAQDRKMELGTAISNTIKGRTLVNFHK